MKGTHRTFIREWREHRGLSLQELGKRAGYDHSYLSKIETGAKRYNQTVLEALARELDTEPGALLMYSPPYYEEIRTIRRVIQALLSEPER